MDRPLWQPDPEAVKRLDVVRFADHVRSRHSITINNYHDLYEWSINRRADFWSALTEFTDIRWQTPPAEVEQASTEMRHHRWFPGGRLNYAENLLRAAPDKADLIIACLEGEEPQVIGKERLVADVAALARVFRARDVGLNDVVAGAVCNSYEALVACLASAAVGAAWTSCSPDFGAAAIIDRFGQVAPKVLIYSTGYRYGGKLFDCRGKMELVMSALPATTHSIGIEHLPEFPVTGGKQSDGTWRQAVGQGEPAGPAPSGLDSIGFEGVAFDHPLFILYSSGTTGVPKCIVHGHGGTLMQHLKEHRLHCGIGAGSRLFYYTTCGWMMWNWMVSALASGSSLLTYDGAVNVPEPAALWALADRYGVTAFGTSPRFLSSCMQAGVRPLGRFAFTGLRTILSTGSPLLPEHYDYVYGQVSPDVHLASISGGTDIVSCFMLGCPWLPVHRGEIQCLGLGMAVEAWNDAGKPVVGEKGELVCTQPFVSMPVAFFGRDGDEKYRRSYFDHYPGRDVWRHGDYIELTERGGVIIYGRSDATLNPGGVRIGTAEIYRVVETMPGVSDSIAVSLNEGGDSKIVLFVKLGAGQSLDDALTRAIRSRIKEALSPRHVPWGIFAVEDIPYTRSGKKMEIAVEKAIHGDEVGNLSAMANPDSINGFVQWHTQQLMR